MGRWLSPDWSKTPTPVPYANFSDPQTLNLYGYVRNNPLAKIDLDGHKGCTVDGEKHGTVWCKLHDWGITQTQKEQADAARKQLSQTNLAVNGQPVGEWAKGASDKQVFDLQRQFMFTMMYAPSEIGQAASIMTQWGWSGSPDYIKARNELRSPGTKETLQGKVPTKDEAVRMIEETG